MLKEYETISDGEYAIVIDNNKPAWNSAEVKQLLDKMFKEAIKYVENYYPLGNCLKVIVVSDNVVRSYNKFISHLLDGTPSVTAPLKGNVLAGKIFNWRNGDREFAGIIFFENIVAGAIDAESFPCTVIVHELTHVGEKLAVNSIRGREEQPLVDDWRGIKEFIARSVNSERIANKVAYQLIKTDKEALRETIFSPVDIFYLTQQSIRESYQNYLVHHDLLQMWQEANIVLSRLFDSFGRAIGFLESMEDTESVLFWKELAEKMENINPAMKNVLLDFAKIFQAMGMDYSEASFESLYDIIEQGFTVIGIKPRYLETGSLWIDLVL